MAVAAAETLASELTTLSQGCGLLDRSGRGKLALTGAGAIEFLNGQVTNELDGLRSGEGRYAAFLTHKGKMLGDLRILATGAPSGEAPRELLLDTERVALQGLFDMIRRFKVGFDVELHKRTVESALLSLIGPGAPAFAPDGLAPEEHASAPALLAGVQGLAVRTDAGIDVICSAEDAERVRVELVARGATPVSDAAAECLRIERGRPRYGIDLDDKVIPQEAGLNERAVSFTKGCYVGQETVARLYYRGKPNRHLRGLRLSEPAGAGAQLRLREKVVGALGSTAVSPSLGPIALALVRREAPPGTTVAVGDDGAAAEVVELPFAAA